LDLQEKFITDVSLDKKISVKFWKSSGSEVRTLDAEQITLAEVCTSQSALVITCNQQQLYMVT